MNRASKVIEAENIKVLRGRVEVLDFPSFYLGDQEILSLIGPNGSGKSSLLLTLSCLLKSLTGRILFRSREISSNQEVLDYRRKIAMVFQEPLLFDTTVFNNVASGLKIRGLPREEIRTRVMKGLERFNIAHLADRSARKLSGGEAQRASLARALATEPEVLFLDEPFAALDPPTRQSIINDMEKIFRETGIAVVLVTHDASEALRLSDRIMVMDKGRIIQAGSPSDVMNRPANRFVAEFGGMESIISGTVFKNSNGAVLISVNGGAIEALGDWAPGERVFCGIRPENVEIDSGNHNRSMNDENVFLGKITGIISTGPLLKVTLDCGFPLVAYANRKTFPGLKLVLGEPITALFKASAVHLLSDEN
jgi:tungstate transport system ATP-binding protein